ncbi:hypothetical protein GJ496_009366 [Pomphorhynchus laevis]|nr:hypothetical protein GJ496_009366 [Pomphorhynchus laevis]
MTAIDDAKIIFKDPLLEHYPECGYAVEVIKNGVVIQNIDICKQPYILVGRSPECGITLAHTSISRRHAIIQWRKVDDRIQPYLLDLGSTHGTLLNKQNISSNTYYKLCNGYRMSFGASSRHFIIIAPDECNNPADFISTDITHSQMRSIYERIRNISKKVKKRRMLSDQQLIDQICYNSDQMEDDLTQEKAYHNDPKAELAKYFDRVGRDMRFHFEELPSHQFMCSITLPAEDEFGKPIIAEVVDSGRKKQIIRKCALEACNILDNMNLLDPDEQLSFNSLKSRDERLAENDFYSSDEDSFFDRTGELEKKRRIRAQRYINSANGKNSAIDLQTVHTFQSSTELVRHYIEEEKQLKTKLVKAKSAESAIDNNDLDQYIKSLQQGALGSRERAEIRFRLTRLFHEKSKALKLVKLSTNCTSEYKNWLKELEKLENELKAIENSSNVSDITVDENVAEKQIDNANVDIVSVIQDNSKQNISHERKTKNEDKEQYICKFKGIQPTVMQHISIEKASTDDLFEEVDKFIEWQPPKDQHGDGRTSLNDKLGY